MNIHEEFAHLVHLTQLYLHQEYKLKDWKETDKESLEYYRNFVRPHVPKKESKPPPPQKKQAPPPSQPDTAPISRTFERQRESVDNTQTDLCDIRSTFEKVSPQLKLKDPTPTPQLKKQAGGQEIDLLILSLNDHPEHHAFLIKVGAAVHNKNRKSRVVTVNSPTDVQSITAPRMVVGTKTLFAKFPDLLWPEETRIYQLSSVSDYIHHPERKRELWNAICSALSL